MIKLIGTDGERYYTFELEAGTYQIGRKGDSKITIPHKTVSRKHAELEIDPAGDHGWITDLGSHNGTTVNNVRVEDRVPVKVGDSICFGNTDFRLSFGDQTEVVATRPALTQLSDMEPEKSVFLSMNEALKPLPAKVTERPELFPTLSEMAKMLGLSDPKEVMLEKYLELVSRIIPADRLAVLGTTTDSDDVFTIASLIPSGKDMGSFTLSRTIIKQLLDEKNAILIGDATLDPRYAGQESIIMSEVKSAMAVPLFDEGKVLGVLYVDTTNPLHTYTDDYLRLLALFGNIISSRLLNYELLEEREERRIMDAELNRAASIQKNLLLVNPPTVDGYSIAATLESSRSVGGDLYDITLLEDGCLLFLVADVSGKGMGAALLMSNILASFRVLYDQEPGSLLPMVEKVSLQLFRHSAPGDFATMFVGVIDPSNGKMTYINAGHNPPLLVRSDGSLEKLEASGTMIGVFDVNTWSEEHTKFNESDLLFVFSDGVTEAEGPSGQYGDDRTEEMTIESRTHTPQEIARILREDIEKFVEGETQSDDVTMLIVKRNS